MCILGYVLDVVGESIMSKDKEEIENFVKTVVEKFAADNGYPSNIIDHVFYEIEQSAVYMRRYERLVDNSDSGKHTINPWIGKLVKQYARMETVTEGVPAKFSSLIETYTELK